jgi:tRNA nucleotidyltransferase/poly(A) polymerase
MDIDVSLKKMQELSEKYSLSKPFIVGGVPRNIALKVPDPIVDVDITTGDSDVIALAHLFAKAIGTKPKKITDNHLAVHRDGIKYDFSTNFKYPDIDNILRFKGIVNPTELQRDVYSRDFTVNTLLMPLDFSATKDLTRRGRLDIRNKALVCPVDCNISFMADPKRILRAYWFKAKYGFKFSKDVRDAIQAHKSLLLNLNERYASEMANKIIKKDPAMFDEFLRDDMLRFLPETKFIRDLLVDSKRIFTYDAVRSARIKNFEFKIAGVPPFFRTNLDYGEREELEEEEIDDAIECD